MCIDWNGGCNKYFKQDMAELGTEFCSQVFNRLEFVVLPTDLPLAQLESGSIQYFQTYVSEY